MLVLKLHLLILYTNILHQLRNHDLYYIYKFIIIIVEYTCISETCPFNNITYLDIFDVLLL